MLIAAGREPEAQQQSRPLGGLPLQDHIRRSKCIDIECVAGHGQGHVARAVQEHPLRSDPAQRARVGRRHRRHRASAHPTDTECANGDERGHGWL